MSCAASASSDPSPEHCLFALADLREVPDLVAQPRPVSRECQSTLRPEGAMTIDRAVSQALR
jgi:hypothetical protein